MTFIGKVIGAVLGYWVGGVVGALIGLVLGHWLDRGLAATRLGVRDLRAVHRTFFRTTFAVMGHLCKADGRVSEAEIATAEAVMKRMDLSAEQRREAMEHFQAGKAGDFDLDANLDEFRRLCRGHRQLVRLFLEIQIQAALADGGVEAAEQRVLLHIARRLGLSEADYRRLEAFLAGGYRRGQATTAEGPSSLEQAYAGLGISAEASDAEVKRAYRKLMNEHHPDKLVARGLPEEMVRLAQERTQQIRAAYDTVRKARGMK